MLRKECTGKKLRDIGWEVLPTVDDEYVMPLKDVAYYLREEGFDCKVELDTSNEYQRTTWETFDPRKNIYYCFEYMYIREHGKKKWQKVARREHINYYTTINKALD